MGEGRFDWSSDSDRKKYAIRGFFFKGKYSLNLKLYFKASNEMDAYKYNLGSTD